MVFLIHYGETGRLEEAAVCAAALRAKDVRTPGDSLAYYDTIISVLLDRGSGELPDWALTLRELLADRPEQALTHERRQAQRDSGFMYQGRFADFNMIRAELSCGQHEAARRLIRLRRQRGNAHYLDDFFLARAELLAGNREEAGHRFATACRACQRYRAEKRLEIELRLACELSRADVMSLATAAGRLAEDLPQHAAGEPQDLPAEPSGTERLVGVSPVMKELRRTIAQVAPLDAPLLITGETGTGKELVARAVHESGPRSAEPFLALNCGAIAESLLESELFGHEKGAFTGAERAHRGLFEEAGTGTILLDEIGEISPRLQVSLLRVLEAGEVRPVGSAVSRKIGCRIIAATNANLELLAGKGAFRKDLLYRLKRLEVCLHPLRERREDILPLADHFLAEGRSDGLRPRLSAELQAKLRRRDWPGNVRELRNAIERMRLLNSDRQEYGLTEVESGQTTTSSSPPLASTREGTGHPARQGCTRFGRIELVRDLFRQRQKLTRSEVIRELGISQATATAYLKQLGREGLIEKITPTAAPRTHYFRLRTSAGAASSS
jgi:DNA-binding NtrC family response regulator